MELIRQLDDLQNLCRDGTSLCIGVFDGVHRGHQSLIHHAVQHARRRGLRSLAFTFEQHPLRLLAPPYAPRMLTTPLEKAELLAQTGVDLCLMQPFTPEFSRISAEDFMERIVHRLCRARHVTCGPDFRFGHRGAGTIDRLKEFGAQRGFQVEVIDALLDGRLPVRSTRIRQLLGEGRLEDAMRLLGRPYRLSGRVVEGDRRGRQIGYPTANIQPPEVKLIPGDGVYAVRVAVAPSDAESITGAATHHPAMLNIGVRPTFSGQGRTIEAHLFDFSGDLYGHVVGVTFVARVRDEKPFDSPEALFAQLQADEAACRSLLDTNSP